MRVLIAGASGFIGSAILARLRSEGYETLACVRSDRDSAPGDVQVIDFAAATTDDWLRILASIDAVVNCVGVLQDSTRDSTVCAHATGAARLFAACEKAGVRRVIHFSALGVDRPITKFSETKRYGDEALMQRQLDWVILRPSVVVGPAAYGGSALFRGLAGLPLLPRLPASGPLQIVQLSDVVETVFKLLQPNARSRMVLDLAGPERLSVWEVVALFRSWLGWKRQPSFVFAAAGGLVAVPARGFHWVARMATAIAFNGGCGDRPRRHRGRTRLGRIYRRAAVRSNCPSGRPLMGSFFVLKFVHVIGAAVLFGTGSGIAFFMVAAHHTGRAQAIADVARIVVVADFVFTATAAVAQPITGILLAWHVGYALSEGWIVLSILLYLVTGAFWLPVVMMQMRIRDLAAAASAAHSPLPAEYHMLYRLWFAFGFPAFGSVIAIFRLMIARPLISW